MLPVVPLLGDLERFSHALFRPIEPHKRGGRDVGPELDDSFTHAANVGVVRGIRPPSGNATKSELAGSHPSVSDSRARRVGGTR